MQLEMCFDAAFATHASVAEKPVNPKIRKGRQAFQKGVLAELSVERLYTDQGARTVGRRMRCREGEIDLIVADGDEMVFVEVKARRTIDEAAYSLTRKQATRIASAAMFWMAEQGKSDTAMRFDVALVDTYGMVDIRQNALFFDS